MKKIYGFKVLINEKLICRAGFEDKNSVVTCILSSLRRKDDVSEELNLSIGGLISDSDQNASWYNNNNLQEGDKISIEIISSDFDPPATIKPKLSEKDIAAHQLKYQLKHYYKLKEELKEYLDE
jgi:hypothetical protein